ncbi:MAG: acyl-CoA dehydratase activase [Candidatus Adiutrix sp.]|jgi:predicted CoA-substrate-specific enzyme activase|nr:acyl-CoA dehydratase activase [Candidatus Adiutrix sp.]
MDIVALDIGSVAAKALLWSAGEGVIKAVSQVPSAWQPQAAAKEALAALYEAAPLNGRPPVAALTGYGRALMEKNEAVGAGPVWQFNEIKALARGLNHVAPEVRLILDVGGQDSKALAIDDRGRVLDFILNDKCAAGAGAFIDGVCLSFDLSREEFGALAAAGRPAPLNSMCAVFAQTELVAQIAQGVSRADLAAGILASLATRLKTQCGRLFAGGSAVALTGGLSRLDAFVELLRGALAAPVMVPPWAPYLAALGAALLAAEKAGLGAA